MLLLEPILLLQLLPAPLGLPCSLPRLFLTFAFEKLSKASSLLKRQSLMADKSTSVFL